jgi:hypothetical protein
MTLGRSGIRSERWVERDIRLPIAASVHDADWGNPKKPRVHVSRNGLEGPALSRYESVPQCEGPSTFSAKVGKTHLQTGNSDLDNRIVNGCQACLAYDISDNPDDMLATRLSPPLTCGNDASDMCDMQEGYVPIRCCCPRRQKRRSQGVFQGKLSVLVRRAVENECHAENVHHLHAPGARRDRKPSRYGRVVSRHSATDRGHERLFDAPPQGPSAGVDHRSTMSNGTSTPPAPHSPASRSCTARRRGSSRPRGRTAGSTCHSRRSGNSGGSSSCSPDSRGSSTSVRCSKPSTSSHTRSGCSSGARSSKSCNVTRPRSRTSSRSSRPLRHAMSPSARGWIADDSFPPQ